jgi:hypothetical protein
LRRFSRLAARQTPRRAIGGRGIVSRGGARLGEYLLKV